MSASRKRRRRAAKLMRPLFDVPGIGRIAILREALAGPGVGWMTPATS